MTLSFDHWLANIAGKQFLQRFLANTQNVVPRNNHDLIDRTCRSAQLLFNQEKTTCPDTQATIILGLCTLTLASYRELVAEIDHEQTAYLVVKSTVGQLYQGVGRFMFRPLLWLSRDSVTLMSKINWKKWNQRIYGQGMEFDQEVSSDSVSLIVNRCAFHHFFERQGEPHLTQVFCAWDRLWMDVVDASTRPIRTERPMHHFNGC